MKEGVVLEPSGPSLAALRRWSGLALVAGGLLMAVATALHPSQETTRARPVVAAWHARRLVPAGQLVLVLVALAALPGFVSAVTGILDRG